MKKTPPSRPPAVTIVVPLYNNENTLVPQLKAVTRVAGRATRKYEIIVAEDKSTDGSRQCLLRAFTADRHVHVILHEQNLGIARTIRSLYQSGAYEYILLFSVDGDWDPEDIGTLIEEAARTGADMVIGVRRKASYALPRRLVSFCFNALPKFLFGIDLLDAGSIKIFRRSILSSMNLTSQSVFLEAELVIRARRAGFSVGGIPIRFSVSGKNRSTAASLSNITAALLDMFRLKKEFAGRKND